MSVGQGTAWIKLGRLLLHRHPGEGRDPPASFRIVAEVGPGLRRDDGWGGPWYKASARGNFVQPHAGETPMLVMDAITEILKREGISTLFSFPTTPISEAAVAGGVRPVICRQERVGG